MLGLLLLLPTTTILLGLQYTAGVKNLGHGGFEPITGPALVSPLIASLPVRRSGTGRGSIAPRTSCSSANVRPVSILSNRMR